MRKQNIMLFLFVLLMAVAWGIAYWLFFADKVTGG